MTTATRIRRYLLCLLAGVSLFVSPVSACACSHHATAKVEVKTSCHEHASPDTHGAPSTENGSPCATQVCICGAAAPAKAFAKAASLKLNKHIAALPPANHAPEPIVVVAAGPEPDRIDPSVPRHPPPLEISVRGPPAS